MTHKPDTLEYCILPVLILVKVIFVILIWPLWWCGKTIERTWPGVWLFLESDSKVDKR